MRIVCLGCFDMLLSGCVVFAIAVFPPELSPYGRRLL